MYRDGGKSDVEYSGKIVYLKIVSFVVCLFTFA